MPFDHQPSDCQYENGCSGCCGRGRHDVSTWCERCKHYTVHPERHQHEGASSHA